MSVGLLVVTHGQIGRAVIDAAQFILGNSLSTVQCVPVLQSGSESPDLEILAQRIAAADEGQGVLIFTDLAGASPSNAIEDLVENRKVRVVSGFNLPMLIRAWNYRTEPLDRLAQLAMEGGLRGIAMDKE